MTPSEYEFLKQFLKSRSGLVLSDEKQYLVESRLVPVTRRTGHKNLSALIADLGPRGSEELKNTVVEAMTTNESFFFRDKTPFDHFRKTMLPSMLTNRAGSKRVRIWCAAASTGQEPYSIGMCLQEDRGKTGGFRFEILGTDISSEVLEKARMGIYSQFEVQRGLPIQMLLKFFSQQGELWQVAPELRAMVQWRKLNLLQNFSHLGEFDIIFCRNVLIYFDQDTKRDILQRLAKQMPSDGFLVLGAAETVVGLTDAFEPVPDHRGLYRPRKSATTTRAPLGTTSPAQPAKGPVDPLNSPAFQKLRALRG
ncbi:MULTISPECIES: CheR family methyltransferase [Pseudovibrio]|uniref:CheR family methyltransferase n=1 Tax=Stappiaceae TaxID=2821832 RepID=UPI002365EE4F|nr:MULTISPECIES: protein-glutamate O-methyltransferase CheR [Pseudovibrio]MDD7911946.1 protein-glutamate O-methyltransferase CheR [Pseudovibrio exalbescens]MDX5595388.1 protein-glutamate O-methyltransferase CheR [Pseudovibrio sp. SPO723]